MNIIKMSFLSTFTILLAYSLAIGAYASVKSVDGNDPGSCDQSNHGETILIKDREDNEILLICTESNNILEWKAVDGSALFGEYFNPAYDCADILDKDEEAQDGFYWVKYDDVNPKKVWCDMKTDGGGFMLIGRKNNSFTWSVPSNDNPVEPFGAPHWSSAFGDVKILDFRVQVATSENFTDTKAHWYFRLEHKRPLKNLMILNQGGCGPTSPGIGDITYVKDLQKDEIVTTKFRCSRFGGYYHPSTKFGWAMMNSCLQKPCQRGFAYLDHPTIPIQIDFSGAFSYSTVGTISGIIHNATAFVGCDKGHCCGCFGPAGETKEFCAHECKPLNGGTITTNVYTWFWVRSALPKSLWKKCMEYKVTKNSGEEVWYKLLGGSSVPKVGRCAKKDALLNDGIVVVPDAAAAKKVPPIPGLLLYRKDNKELYLKANQTWKIMAKERKILHDASTLVKPKLNQVQTKMTQKLNLVNAQFNELDKQLQDLNQTFRVAYGIAIADYPECTGYSWLTQSSRNENYNSGSYCDSSLSTGWYRFGGDAGNRISTTCNSNGNRCGTYKPGWMKGSHPTVAEGIVSRTVCFAYSGSCCYSSSQSIKVLNCGLYFIYKLSATSCYNRYCGSFH